MIRTLKISAAIAIAGAFSVAQAATCPSESYGAISFKSYGDNKCVAIIDATGDQRNDAINIPNTVTVDSVYYFRNGAEDVMNANSTLFLPFEVKKGCKVDGSTLKRITSITYNATDAVWRARADYIDMTKDSLTANTPYLFSYTHGLVKDGIGYIGFGGGCTFNLNTSSIPKKEFDASLDNMGQSTGLKGTWTFKGTYEKIVFDENTKKGVYGFASKTEGKFSIGQFVKAGTGASVPPMRAYLVYNSQGTMGKAAPGLSFAPAADNSDLLPPAIDVIENAECFQDGDGIFEVKNVLVKDAEGNSVLDDNGDAQYARTACIDGKSDARLQTLSIPEDVTVDSIAYNRTFAIGSGWNNPAVASTIVLPFTVSENQCISNAVFFDILNIRNWGQEDNLTWQIMVEQRDNSKPLIPNHPYIVLANDTNIIFNRAINGGYKKCAYNITYSNVLEDTVFSNVDGLPGTWTFKGTYEKITFNESSKKGVYGFAGNSQGDNITAGQFIKAGTGATVPPMRAYLKYNSAGVLAKAAAGTEIAEEDLPETIVVKFIDGDGSTTATGTMNTITGEITMDENKWFDMKGRMMNKKPTVKGTYYNKGQKVIIK
ncbi:hypothetical protein SAMN05720766_1064 [Fibrobacter sp. UWH9]|uniref:hypothetical protein n=1 Tax=Fibrobacter sp. UWH9 TaxID=1896213 RepID=UPI00091C0AD4|nr:hypothetical protein [Fibrobacter sp. UWH9]SHH00715.1 hypothetical protein SAMN05720766_1064 [Fibrobacter sp. UWH9]